MPSYEFVCEKCGATLEEEHSITEKLRDSCPHCEATEPDFHQVYQKTQPFAHVYDCHTIGQQAEKNQKEWGKELTSLKRQEIESRYQSQKSKAKGITGEAKGKAKTGGRKKPALDLNKIKDVTKYIQTGDKT